MKRSIVTTAVVLSIILMVCALAFPGLVSASPPAPQAQFFHDALASQSFVVGSSAITEVTQAFTTNQSGALDVVSEQQAVDPNVGCYSVTTSVLLDTATIATNVFPGNYSGQDAIDLDITTTSSVSTGSHSVSITYQASINPGSGCSTASLVLEPGTFSLIVATPATSN